MNTRTTVAVVAMSLAAVGVAVGAQAASRPALSPAVTSASAVSTDLASLAFNREEELMARDLYSVFATAYPTARQFSMIARAEQRHTDAVQGLLSRYALPDPAADHVAGVFQDTALQRLYDGWKAEGLTSLAAAYQVGVDLEKRDIADLDRALAGSLPADADQVLGQLRTGSEHHLAAFTTAATGTSTSAAGTGMGQGGMAGQGNGMGSGSGRGNGRGNDRGGMVGHDTTTGAGTAGHGAGAAGSDGCDGTGPQGATR